MSLAAEKRRKAKALEEAGAALSVKLSARSTRGQRISELQGDDAEADETFWGQGAWQEKEEDDSEFSSEEGTRPAEILDIDKLEFASDLIIFYVIGGGPPVLVDSSKRLVSFW